MTKKINMQKRKTNDKLTSNYYKVQMIIEDYDFPRIHEKDVQALLNDALNCYFKLYKVNVQVTTIEDTKQNANPFNIVKTRKRVYKPRKKKNVSGILQEISAIA